MATAQILCVGTMHKGSTVIRVAPRVSEMRLAELLEWQLETWLRLASARRSHPVAEKTAVCRGLAYRLAQCGSSPCSSSLARPWTQMSMRMTCSTVSIGREDVVMSQAKRQYDEWLMSQVNLGRS